MSAEDRKRREVELGLANNAFGAAAGTVATVQARNAWKRAKAAGTIPNTRVGRFLLRSKVNPAKAIMAAGAANVGAQAVNGLLDAQSAQYFARERVNMGKKPVKKELAMTRIEDAGNGYGTRLDGVSKEAPRAPGTPPHSKTRKGTQAAYVGGLGAALGGAATQGLSVRRYVRQSMAGKKPNARLHVALARGGRAAKIGGLGVAAATAIPMWRYGVQDLKATRQADLAEYKRKTGKDYPGIRAVRRELREKKAAEGVGKARRFDPEADRQRRLGAYAGLAGGGALIVGDRAAREVSTSTKRGFIVDRATGKKKAVTARHVGFKPGRGKIGAGLTAGAAGLAALSAASYKRGISERNRPWT